MPKTTNKLFTSPIDWNFITSSIESGKCVVLIGPEILSNTESSFKDRFIDFLNTNNSFDSEFFQYYDKHGLFNFANESEQAKIYQSLRMYHQSLESNISLFEKLAAIPVPLAISLNPDNLLAKAFSSYRHQFKFYNQKPQKDEIDEKHKADTPILFYLFGKLDQQETLILTYENLLGYIFSLLGKEPDIPDQIKDILREVENFLFLGFRFDHWYMQLIIRILTSQGGNKGRIKYAFDKARYSEDTYLFYTDHFNVTFLEMTPVEFIDELYKHCQEKSLLRPPVKLSEQLHLKEKLEILFENDDLIEVISLLKNYFREKGEPHENEYDESIMLIGRLKNLEKNEREGLLTTEDIQLHRSRIRKACRELIKLVQL